jgi:hypothetical protein
MPTAGAYSNSCNVAYYKGTLYSTPAGVAASCMRVAVTNKTGGSASGLRINYTLSVPYNNSGVAESPRGYVVYCTTNQTGVGNWVNVGNHYPPADTVGSNTNISFTISPSGGWAANAPLYVMWADDNASGNDVCYAVSNVTFTAVGTSSGFTAYNDCVYSAVADDLANAANVTRYSLAGSYPATGTLTNQSDGAATPVVVTLVGNNGTPSFSTGGGTNCLAGTDAATVFDGKAGLRGTEGLTAGVPSASVDLVFTNLNPAKAYVFATTANRGCTIASGGTVAAWATNKWTTFRLMGVTNCANASSVGVNVITDTPTNSAVSFSTGENTFNGYVARWSGIRCDASGSFRVRAESEGLNSHSNSGCYGFAAFMLKEGPAVNLPPSVTITNPVDWAGVAIGSSMNVGVNATDDGSVTNVEVFLDGAWLGSNVISPYSVSWPNATLGLHTLKAVAWDNTGLATTSSVVNVSVVRAPGYGALRFDGSDDHVTMGSGTALGAAAFTLECWMRKLGTGLTSTSGNGGIVAVPLITKGRGEAENSNVDCNYFFGILPSGALAADFEQFYADGGMAAGQNYPVTGISTAAGDGAWHHVAVTYDGSNWVLYVDGALDKALNIGNHTPRFDSIQHAGLGTAMNSTGVREGAFQGVIDEARIWNFARTQAEIVGSMSNEVASASGLIGRWSLNEYSGTVATNSGSTSINGTLVNGPVWTTGYPLQAAIVVNQAPSVSITSPTNGASAFMTGVAIQANATDDVAVTNVAFYADGNLLGNDAASPYSWTGTSAPLGVHTLTAVAWDDTGLASTSATVTVTVTLPQTVTRPFVGVTRMARTDTSPRPLKINVLDIDLTAPGLRFKLTPPGGDLETLRQPTLAFMTNQQAQVAVNCHFFTPYPQTPDLGTSYLVGIAASEGNVYSAFESNPPSPQAIHTNAPGLNIDVNNQASIVHRNLSDSSGLTVAEAVTLWNTVSGSEMILSNGVVLAVDSTWNNTLNPRTLIGLATNNHLVVVVIDGRQTGVSEGMTVAEAALMLKNDYGVTDALNLDGGGSSTLAMMVDGAPQVVNTPSDNPPRSVGSNLAIFATPLYADNQAPTVTATIAPTNGAASVTNAPTLDVTVSDREGAPLTVNFYGRPAGAVTPVGADFTIAVLPDTQFYSQDFPWVFTNQTQWIVANRTSQNIAYVAHLGDVTDKGDNQMYQWTNSASAMYLLEDPITTGLPAGIPYGIAPGNHDHVGGTVGYNQYFGISHFIGKPWYGGHMGTDNQNHYDLISAGGIDFIILYTDWNYTGLSYAPIDAWANSVLQAYPDRRAIIVRHGLLEASGAWADDGLNFLNTVKTNANVFLLMNGHSAGERQYTETVNGRRVDVLCADYQDRTPQGGNGYLRLYQFSPSNNVIHVKTYSPYVGLYETDANSQFDIPYPMGSTPAPFQLIKTVTAVPSGGHATAVWTNLAAGTSYQWYATVSDGTNTASGATNLFTVAAMAVPVAQISNPYSDVNWGTVLAFKGNLHTHSTNSDGNQAPAAAIDSFDAQGYDFLAMTDHNFVTYPWSTYGRDPVTLGIVDIQGNELSSGHHIVSLFSGYANTSADETTLLTGVGTAGGLAFFAHPGRYTQTAQWYADHYLAQPHCIGQEIYNQGDRYTGDRVKWDQVLSILMPSRPVWGFSNDDSHDPAHVGKNRTYLLLSSLSSANVRTALEDGQFYATYSTSAAAVPPAFTNIAVDTMAGTVTVRGTGYTQVRWISQGTQVATGDTLDLIATPGVAKYVRAELHGSGGIAYSNPFGVAMEAGNPTTNLPPVVSIASPANSATVATNFTITANATDDGTVTNLAFYADGNLLGNDTAAPYSWTWGNAAIGSHALTAVATDNNGAATTSSVVTVTVMVASFSAVDFNENFDSMGAGTTPPPGWSILNQASGSPNDKTLWVVATPIIQTGVTMNPVTPLTLNDAPTANNNSGYNALGASGQTGDRCIASAPTSIASVGIQTPPLTNNTGGAISVFNISYDIKRFTAGSLGADELPGYWLFYSVNGGTTWYNVSALNPTLANVPNTVGITSIVATNIALSASWASGGTLQLRWIDDNGIPSSPDQILGLDNVHLTAGSVSGSAPMVSITSPANGATVGTNILVQATASDSDGTVTNVAFYADGSLLGNDTTAPYSFTWNSASTGSHALTAVAWDNIGLAGTSAVVNVTVILPANNISFGATGTGTLTFDSLPATTQSATASVGADKYSYATAGQLDAAVQGLNASAVAGTLVSDTVALPAKNGLAVWSSYGGGFIQTCPTSIGATLLKGTLVNESGSTVPALRLAYQYTVVSNVVEEVSGQRVFYSLTGAAGSWTLIPSLSGVTASTNFDVNVTLSAPWTNGATLYLLWADDNDTVNSPDTFFQIDNFAASVGVPAVPFGVALSTPVSGAIFAQGAELPLAATATGDGPATNVTFYVDGSLLSSDATAPYTAAWTATTLGSHALLAVAQDASGQTKTSATVNVTVVAPLAATPWKFGVMADTQWTGVPSDPVNNPNDVAVSIIKQLNPKFIAAGVKFVVQVGDLTESGQPADLAVRATAAQPLYNAGIGFFPLRGNHETSQIGALALTNSFPQTQGAGANLAGARFLGSPDPSGKGNLQGLSYAFDMNNARFVLLDQFERLSGVSPSVNDAIVDQVPWIGTTLSNRTANTHAFVFAHKNLIGQDHTDVLFGANAAANPVAQNSFLAACEQADVGYVLGGHDHIHQRSRIASPDGISSVRSIICASDSSKFYTPSVPSRDQTYNSPRRETSVAQDLYRIGYYIFTVDGPLVTVDYYASDETFPSGNSPAVTPALHFSKRETFGYSLNGNEYAVPQGNSYTNVSESIASGSGFLGTAAKVLGGTNASTLKDGSARALVKTVNTGWQPATNTASDILTLWGLTDIAATQSDTYTLSMSYDASGLTAEELQSGTFALATCNTFGRWVLAVDQNVGGQRQFVNGPWNSSYTLGTYGVDTNAATVWAVLNYTAAFAASHVQIANPGYVAGDFHQHTLHSDGSLQMAEVFAKDALYGLTWWANSEHGGSFLSAYRWKDIGGYAIPSGLANHSWDEVKAGRLAHPAKTVIQGLELNCPGHEHVSTAIISDQFPAATNLAPIAEFEYRFDANDADASGGPGGIWSGKSTVNNHTKATNAVAWLQANYPEQSWFVPAHPERANSYTIAHFRDFNNVGPDVAFGFESMPGHQKSSGRGGYGTSAGVPPAPAGQGGTYGGTGIYAAQVGGLWDAMLAEGRCWWLFASSDFHNTSGDFWPGEYQKTYIQVSDTQQVNSAEATQMVADGLRSGNSWVVEGDLIDSLSFSVSNAVMGQTCAIPQGGQVTATIRVHDSEGLNNNTYSSYTNPALDHIDVIAGSLSSKIAPFLADGITLNPAYSQISSDARVIARFDAVGGVTDSAGVTSVQWTDLGGGWREMTLPLTVTNSVYLRLRGSNLGLNVANQTDSVGNPLADSLLGANTAAMAFDDLWFYSNPIFLRNPAANIAPTVSISSPTTGGEFVEGVTIPVLASATDADGSVTQVCFYADGALLGSDTTYTYQYNWANAPTGTHTLVAVAFDNLGLASTSTVVTITVSESTVGGESGLNTPALRFRVLAGTDDVEELKTTGFMDIASSDLELIQDGSKNQWVGMRFANVVIPQGAKVVSAYIQFTCDEMGSKNINPFSVTVCGEASDNAAGYTTVASNLSSRARTAAVVAWSNAPDWQIEHEAGAAQRTPDIAAVVQEIISRPGWAEGHALALMMEGQGGRCAEAFEGEPTMTPELVVVVVRETSVSVTAGTDDVEELKTTGFMDIASSDLELIQDGSKNQWVGMRFNNVNIPQGTKVLNAYLQFTCDEMGAKNINPFNVTVCGEASDNAGTYTTTVSNLSTRARTAAAVAWSNAPDWQIEHEAGAAQRTPDLSAVVQEILNRPGWAAGQSLALMIEGQGGRCAEAFEGEPTMTPRLVIQTSIVKESSFGPAASSDDAEENNATGAMDLTSSDLELIMDGSKNQTVGMRFPNVQVPVGALLVDAYIQFTCDEMGTKNINPFSLTIRGEATDNAATFTTTASNIAVRARTTASAAWSNAPDWQIEHEADLAQRTPSILGIVSEIMARPGWANGNAMVFLLNGQGGRCAEAWDGEPTMVPQLVLVYAGGSSSTVNTAPTVVLTSPSNGAVVDEGQPMALSATASDNGSVSNVTFNVDGVQVTNDLTAPYTATWTAATVGGHTLTAVAWDDTGLASTSATVNITVVLPTPSISFGVTGTVVQTLGTLPSAMQWATASVGADKYSYTTGTQLDAAVQTLAASAITGTLVSDTVALPLRNGLAVWSSYNGGFMQTCPTSIGATLLKATLVNQSGTNLSFLRLSYPYTVVTNVVEDVPGQHVFYSLTGAADGWTLIPALSGLIASTNLDVTVSLSSPWTNGATLYLLWADDNDTTYSPDTYFQIDNFVASPGVPPVPFSVALTTPATGALFAQGYEVMLAATASGEGPATNVDFYVDGALASSDATVPYTATWTAATIGSHTLKAVAQDASGHTTTSAVVTVTVTLPVSTAPWKFGVMSDTQWTGVPSDPVNNPNDVAVSIINQLNPKFIAAGVKFVVQVGDLTESGNPADVDVRAAAAQPLYNAGIGFFPLRGNHESGQTAGRQVTNDFPQTQGLGANVYSATNFTSASSALAGLSYAFDYGNTRMVLLDQFTRLDGSGSAVNDAMVDQVPWVGTTLSNRLAGTHAFVFSHKNLIGENHTDSLFGANPSANTNAQNQFIGALQSTGVRYTLSGHDHVFQRSMIASPDGQSSVEEIICGSDSSKFYTPGSTNSFSGQKYREMPLAQDLYRITYYVGTVEGPRFTMDYYASDETFPSGNSPAVTPTLHFNKRETFGYSLNGQRFLVPQGGSYTTVSNSIATGTAYGETYKGTTARILHGVNGSTAKDYNNRAFTREINIGWAPSPTMASDVLTLWGLADLATNRTDTYVLSMSYDLAGVTPQQIDSGAFGLLCKNGLGNWVNAVTLNVGGTVQFVLGAWNSGYTLGTYGVDTTTHTVWAVVNHASDFAAGHVAPFLPTSLTGTSSGTVITNGNTTLSWTAVAGATGYTVALTMPNSSNVFFNTTGTGYTLPEQLLNGTYSWTVTPYNSDGNGPASASASFTIVITSPAHLLGYVSGDFHQHTTYTDGSNPFATMMAKNDQFGLDWWANSEHGGKFNRNAAGPILSGGYDTGAYAQYLDTTGVTFLGDSAGTSGGHTNMWRWQSLRDLSFSDVLTARGYCPTKTIVQGVEWNVPGHEHCSVGIVTGEFGPSATNANAVAQFEYLWDGGDADLSGGAGSGWLAGASKNNTNNHAKAVQAVAWMQANYPASSWMVAAHPERRGVQAYPGTYTGTGSQGYSAAAFRDLNNAGPSVFFGFESMPGHQKAPGRGGYAASASGGGTAGGCGYYAAKVGGLWDALLGEGRGFWLFANSDFHTTAEDFWPGEYQKTYTRTAGGNGPQAVVDGLRSGDSFVVEGDLVDALDFTVNGSAMGSTVTNSGTAVTVSIRVHDPEGANNCPTNLPSGINTPALDHIDLIAGSFGPKIDPASPLYNMDSNATTRVIARFGATGGAADANGIVTTAWTDLGGGWKQMTLTYDTHGRSTYFRLRGSNIGVGAAGQTDAAGNPLVDPQTNTALDAWADLWFYSNPVFVKAQLPPSPIALSAVDVTTNRFTARWTASEGATSYLIDVSETNTFTSYTGIYNNWNLGDATECLVTGLTNGTTYYYRLRAANSDGVSTNSNTVEVPVSDNTPYIQYERTNGVASAGSSDVVDLTKLFHGSGKSYSVVSNSNPALVTTSFSGSDLILDYAPGGSGSASITVRVTDLSTGFWVETTITVSVGSAPTWVPGPIVFNRQVGLFEQSVTVSNTSPFAARAVTLTVTNLPAGVTLKNATDVDEHGNAEIRWTGGLASGGTMVFKLQYYTKNRGITPTSSVAVSLSLEDPQALISGTMFSINGEPVTINGTQSFRIEFSAVPGRTYYIQYKALLEDPWKTVQPPIIAPVNRIQWIDSGPPSTESAPGSVPSRFYQVIEAGR